MYIPVVGILMAMIHIAIMEEDCLTLDTVTIMDTAAVSDSDLVGEIDGEMAGDGTVDSTVDLTEASTEVSVTDTMQVSTMDLAAIYIALLVVDMETIIGTSAEAMQATTM